MCYWIGTEQQKEFIDSIDANYDEYKYTRRVIVSFDMSREVFHEVLFPHDLFDFYGIIDGIRIERVLGCGMNPSRFYAWIIVKMLNN